MELRSNQTMTALYCRLSQEDELAGKSNSIHNQANKMLKKPRSRYSSEAIHR